MTRSLAWILAGLAAFLGAPLTAAESALHASKPEVRKALVAVVEAQLTAFRQHDLPGAYAYASTPLRAQKSLQAFGRIVQTTYPEIWTNQRAEFGLARDRGEEATLLVHVFGKGSDASYDFTLVREEKGWRIAGVLPPGPHGANL